MTGCCVPGCNNSSAKGFYMTAFPTNPQRRALWVANIITNVSNWKLKKYHRICEAHFPKNMWEKPRCDGKLKLKCSAVPVIFPFYNFHFTKHALSNSQGDREDGNANIDNFMKKEIVEDRQHQLNYDNINQISTVESHIAASRSVDTREETDWKKKCEELRTLLRNSEQACEELRNSMKRREKLIYRIIKKGDTRILRKHLKELKEGTQNYKQLITKLEKVLNKDQVKVLGDTDRNCKWSDEIQLSDLFG